MSHPEGDPGLVEGRDLLVAAALPVRPIPLPLPAVRHAAIKVSRCCQLGPPLADGGGYDPSSREGEGHSGEIRHNVRVFPA